MNKLFLTISLLFVFTGATLAADSDLVALAKKEKERRAKVEAKKTLTNQDIEAIRKKQPASGIESTEAEETTTETTKEGKKEAVDPTQTEEYWRARKQEADQRVQDAQSRVERLQSEINSLTTAFYAEADGVGQRPLIESERGERIKELEQAKADLESARAESSNLEEEARKAGALPGWLRD